MFPVDSLPSAYCHERAAADDEKRRARLEAEAARQLQQQQARAMTKQQQSLQASSSTPTPSQTANLAHALQHQRPPLHRPVSSSVLGNIFQGFVRATSSPPGTPSLRTPSPSSQRQLGEPSAAEAVMAMLSLERRKQQELEDERRKQDFACFMTRA